MELLFAVLGGILAGGIAHVILPWRSLRGVLLGPTVGGGVAAIVWEALSWAGWPYGGTWIWVAAIAGGGVVALVVEWVVGPRREHRDQEYFAHASTTGRV